MKKEYFEIVVNPMSTGSIQPKTVTQALNALSGDFAIYAIVPHSGYIMVYGYKETVAPCALLEAQPDKDLARITKEVDDQVAKAVIDHIIATPELLDIASKSAKKNKKPKE